VTKQIEHQDEGDRALQREIRQGRSFSLADAIGREGRDFLKGYSPVPRLVQARRTIIVFISRQLDDRSGALQAVLITWVESDDAAVSQHIEAPLQALVTILNSILSTPITLHELTRQVSVKWGQMSDEQPYFQTPGQPAHPQAEYSHESVADKLAHLLSGVEYAIELQRQESERAHRLSAIKPAAPPPDDNNDIPRRLSIKRIKRHLINFFEKMTSINL
jgi:hypothetical protein